MPSKVCSALAKVPTAGGVGADVRRTSTRVKRGGAPVGSVIKKRRKRMSKKKHRKLLRRTRMQRRKQGK
ncbi:hypothetical protein Atai01_03760 [Amycolatopsis taiwanensis]|uniref:Ribosomal protein mS38 C-terminal domain-containing protein n=1 Tax=Amycolatopsis taiwanensis TaxID=342230 RepID=A0A9W6VDS8_9PSEU|nr:hypothetical protein Atai01_03760 [Amycolatopsis taiwanensis]